MLAACAGLVIVGRCSPRGLPILLGVIVIGFVSYATVGYWSGHYRPSSARSAPRRHDPSSVGSRPVGTPVHQYPVYGRVVLAGLIVGLAVLGLLRRRFRGVSDRASPFFWSRR